MKNVNDNLKGSAIVEGEIDLNRIREIERFSSESGFSKITGKFPINVFDRVDYGSGLLKKYSLVFDKFQRGELINLPILPRVINDRESFKEVMERSVATVVLQDVFDLLDFNDVNISSAEEYWEVLKRSSKLIFENNDVPILILGNQMNPAWIFDWQIDDLSQDYKRPPDMRITNNREGERDFLFEINGILVYVASIKSGVSVLLSKSTFDILTFTRFKEDVFVKAEYEDVIGSGNLVDLSLSFYREIKIKSNSALRINFGSDI